MSKKQFAVYIMASGTGGTLYVGVTSNLPARAYQHRTGMVEGFTRRYGVKMLVWYELRENPVSAIQREKRIKQWRRSWKIQLIEAENPDWRDLFPLVATF